MKLISVCNAVLFAAVLGGAFAYGFEGRVPIYKSSDDNAPVKQSEVARDGVAPIETQKRIAEIDSELLWENWSDPESIPSSPNGTLKAPTLIDKNSPRKRGAVLLEYDAIVVWNGLENADGRELLVFGSREKSIETMKSGETDVALGITPLNGKPSSIRRTGAEYEALDGLTTLKYSYKHPQEDDAPEHIDDPERAPYCAFELEIKDAKSFAADVNNALGLRLPGAETSFSKEDLAVVDAYLKRDVRYFVFDVFDFTERDEASFTKTSLAVEFPTPKLFIPAEIGKIGETDRTAFNILVFTPGRVAQAPGSWFASSEGKPFMIALFPNGKDDGPMVFSLDEFKEYAPTVAKFCEENGLKQLVGRKVVGSCIANETNGDFELIVASDSKETKQKEASPQTETKDSEKKKPTAKKKNSKASVKVSK